MRRVFIIFGEFEDEDIAWCLASGHLRQMARGELLVTAGQTVDEITLILSGEFSVEVQGKEIARLGAGELVGELSFLDARPPYASVRAEESASVLCIPHGEVHHRLRHNPGFGQRFYRSLGLFLASRMRNVVGQIGALSDSDSLQEDQTSIDEIDPDVLERAGIAGQRFEWLRGQLGVE